MKRRRLVSFAGCLLLLASARPAWPQPGAPPVGQPANSTAAAAASGASHTEASGCLAKRGPSRRALAPTRATGKGIVVEHGFEHACCIRSHVATTVTGQNVEVVETLSGKRCRCLCSSTLRTTIPVPPGKYRLAVWLDDHGTRTRITAANLEVVVTAGKSRLVSLGEKGPTTPSDGVPEAWF